MLRFLKITLATAAIGLGTIAVPAQASLDLVSDCHDEFVTIGGQAATACVGYYDKNLLQGNPGDAPSADAATALQILLSGDPGVQDSEPGYTPPYALNVSKILDNKEGLGGASLFSFVNGTQMSGLTVIGVHWGNNGDAGDNNSITAFYLFNLTGGPFTQVALGNNGAGSSNAQLYSTGAVPEPATWAMMLVGFGGIGMAMRRSRRRNATLMQVA
jgi:hypothetical protein